MNKIKTCKCFAGLLSLVACALFVNFLVYFYALNADTVVYIFVWFVVDIIFSVQINIVAVNSINAIRRQFDNLASVISLFLVFV